MGNTTGGKRHNSGDSNSALAGSEYYGVPAKKAPLLVQPSLDDSSDFESGAFRGQLVDRMEPTSRLRAQSLSSGRPVPLEQDYHQKLPTVFKWEGGGKEVMLVGSFTKWKTKIPMVKSHGDFYTIIDLPEGEHQYKFYVDGQWQINPDEPSHTSDIGTVNNIVKVEKSDFEVFDALEKDSVATGEIKSTRGPAFTSSALSGSPPGDYSQEVPVRKPNEKHTAPPLLPPHLLQVILNKDTPINCEPTLLPEPNHVMLNHLYALSIKDGVMVLSATHRYRKKYVTTLLYRPI